MPEPSQEDLRTNFHYDALTGMFKWKNKDVFAPNRG